MDAVGYQYPSDVRRAMPSAVYGAAAAVGVASNVHGYRPGVPVASALPAAGRAVFQRALHGNTMSASQVLPPGWQAMQDANTGKDVLL